MIIIEANWIEHSGKDINRKSSFFKEIRSISVLEVDSVDRPVILILDLSVASTNSHESGAILLEALLGVWNIGLELFEESNGLWILVGNFVGDLVGFDFSHVHVKVEGALSDWNDTLDDVPEDTLVAWSGGQGSWIGPSFVEIKLLDELGKVKFSHIKWLIAVLLLFDEGEQESVVPVNVGVWVSEFHFFEVLFWHDFEEESEDTSDERGVLVLRLLVKEMDDVHLKVEELTVDGVLTWGVEMELDTVERSSWNVRVEKGDGLSAEAVGVLFLGSSLGDINEECVTSLVEFQLTAVLGDLIVLEFEVLVLEVLKDFQVGAEINWSLFLTELADLTWAELGSLLLVFWLNDEVDTWSLGDWVLEALGEVILEHVLMFSLAGWTAELDPFSSLFILLENGALSNLGIVGIVFDVDVFQSESASLLDLLFGPLDFIWVVRGTFGGLDNLVSFGPGESGAISGGRTVLGLTWSSAHVAEITHGSFGTFAWSHVSLSVTLWSVVITNLLLFFLNRADLSHLVFVLFT